MISSVAAITTSLVGAIYYNRETFYFHPTNYKIDSKYDHYINNGSRTIHGLFVKSTSVRNQNRLILLCHGNAGQVNNRIGLMTELSQFGDCYCFDYPGFGKTPGKPGYNSIMKDSNKVLEYWRKKYKDREIVLYGESIGCTIASELYRKNLDIGALICQSGPSSIRDMSISIIGIGFGISEFDTHSELIQCTEKQKKRVLILHSKSDMVVPYNQAVKLASISKSIKFSVIKGGHNDPDINWNKVKKFIRSI
jgi:uncharacterized protein